MSIPGSPAELASLRRIYGDELAAWLTARQTDLDELAAGYTDEVQVLANKIEQATDRLELRHAYRRFVEITIAIDDALPAVNLGDVKTQLTTYTNKAS